MQLPLQVTFRNLQASEAMEQDIRERAAKLEQFCSQIMGCRVVVEARHRHHQQGNLYHARIDITVPDAQIVANRDAGLDHAHEDVYVAIRDAFDAARRQLEDYVRRQRQDVKTHETPAHGKVAELYPTDDFGTIETPDGRAVYFHRNSVLNADFDKLAVGDSLRFSEEMGEKGPQATTVWLEGKHHVAG